MKFQDSPIHLKAWATIVKNIVLSLIPGHEGQRDRNEKFINEYFLYVGLHEIWHTSRVKGTLRYSIKKTVKN